MYSKYAQNTILGNRMLTNHIVTIKDTISKVKNINHCNTLSSSKKYDELKNIIDNYGDIPVICSEVTKLEPKLLPYIPTTHLFHTINNLVAENNTEYYDHIKYMSPHITSIFFQACDNDTKYELLTEQTKEYKLKPYDITLATTISGDHLTNNIFWQGEFIASNTTQHTYTQIFGIGTTQQPHHSITILPNDIIHIVNGKYMFIKTKSHSITE